MKVILILLSLLLEKVINDLRDVELSFAIYIPNEVNDGKGKKVFYMPKWFKFLFLNSKSLYKFSKIGISRITKFFTWEILDDPNTSEIDKKLINSLKKELENFYK